MEIKHAIALSIFALAVKLDVNARAEDAKAFPPEQYTARKQGTLTYNKDVASIVFQHCAGCHRPDQSAPFNLLTYADVQKRAKQVAEVVEKRYMPPWLPESGLVEFAHDRSLSVDQIGVIRQWVAEGTVEGAPADLPTLPKWTEG